MTISKIHKSVEEKLKFPIIKELPFVILLWLFLSFVETGIHAVKGEFFTALLCSAACFWIAYFLVFLCGLFTKVTEIAKLLIYSLIAVFTGLNLYCVSVYHTRLNYDIFEIFSQTNPQEVREYFSMYIGWPQYLYFISFVAMTAIFYWLANKPLKINIKNKRIWVPTLLACSFIAFIFNPSRKESMEVWNFRLEDVVDLRKYTSNPDIETEAGHLPENFILILGESHAKSHSSLYGYDKITNPLLSKRAETGNLMVFENAQSIATNTSNSFKYILNTASPIDNNDIPWYKSIHLIEVLQKAGFNTSWISNQARKGLFNNLSSAAADLCHESKFIREYWKDKKFDGELAELLPETSDKNRAIIFHLMGQHVLFNERYPEEFDRFKAEDYNDYNATIEKRQHLAEYDNATLYNDFVIDKIIEKYSDTDALIIYFPDHGLDVYESDPDYCGHATQDVRSQEIGKSIPFLVYCSDKFIEKRPVTVKRIKEAIRKPLTTDNFIYMAMDILGLKFIDNPSVEQFSIL